MTTALSPPPKRTPAVPAPPGAREPFVAPAPQACEHCGGDGWEPQDDYVRCSACNWTGAAPLVGCRLPRTRAYEFRCMTYAPGREASGHPCRLTLVTAAKERHRKATTHYNVVEIETQFGARAFAVEKVGGREIYCVHIGNKSVSCDCPGETYLATAKANQDAYDCGEEVFPSFGCKHADALHALLLAGWFDLC